MMKKYGLLIALLLGIHCTSAQTGAVSLNKTYKDVTYKTAESGESLKLDIFLPESHTTTAYPVLLYVHGGAWVRGNKNMNEPYFRKALREAALKNGFAVVSINYSLLNDSTRFPAPIADVKDATRWIYAHAAAFRLDTLNIGILGESAGSHLALLTAYTNNDTWEGDKKLEDHASKVNYVINNCGPTDINRLLKTDAGWFTIIMAKLFFPKKIFDLRNQLILQMTSHHINEDKKRVREILKEYSPLTYVTSYSVPTLIFQGNKDKVVPYKQSKALYKLLRKNGVETELIKEKGARHVFVNYTPEQIDMIIERSIAFMKAHLR